MNDDVFMKAMRTLGAVEHGSRWHFDCPLCGAEEWHGGRPQYHCYCYFNAKIDKLLVQCHLCQTHVGVSRFMALRAKRLNLVDDSAEYDAIDVTPYRDDRPEPPWKNSAEFTERWEAYVDREAENLASIWSTNYKPISEATVRREKLGHWVFPYWDAAKKDWAQGHTWRLAVPLYRDGLIVGFRGRAYKDGKSDWQTATKSDLVLMGLDRVKAGARVILCENVIDRLLLEQAYPHINGVAAGGLLFRDEWIAALKAAQIKLCIVWHDHDLSGNGSRWHAAQFEAAWRQRVIEKRRARGVSDSVGMPKPPSPAGIAIVNRLLEAKVPARLYTWERGQPQGADLGSFLLAREPYYNATPTHSLVH